MSFSIFEELDIEIFNEGDNIIPKNNMSYDDSGGGIKDGKEEMREMREIYLNSEDQCEKDVGVDVGVDVVIVDHDDKLCSGNICGDIYVHLRPIELLINTVAVEEVIFKKHLVEILNKHSRECVMEGVVVGYDLVGHSYVPDIVLKFEDGRTFYNENFGYVLRFYI
jgi:hypothetical protein